LEALRQQPSLAERKSETFAGDRIDSAGSVADQRHIPSPDLLQFAIGRHASSFCRGHLRPAKPRVELGEREQRFFQAKLGIARGHGNTNFIVAYGCGISLTVPAPTYSHAVGPRPYAIA